MALSTFFASTPLFAAADKVSMKGVDDAKKQGGSAAGAGGGREAQSVDKARSPSSQGGRLCIALEFDGLNGFETLVPQ